MSTLPEAGWPLPTELLTSICNSLVGIRFLVDDERATQALIADALSRAGLPFEREKRLSPSDVIDFIVGPVGVEVKIKGGKRDIFRQMKRYADHEAIEALLLVTGRAMGLPPTINAKPTRVFSIGSAWL